VLIYLIFKLSEINFNFPIRGGVSRANFLGESSWDATISLFLFIISVFIFTLILHFVKYKSTALRTEDKQVEEKQVIVKNKNHLFVDYVVIFISAIFISPNLQSLSSLTQDWSANGKNWDVQNLATWDELYIYGYKHMVDFWYPYGNLIFTEAYPIAGRLLLWIFQVSFLVILTHLLRNIAGKKSTFLIIASNSIFIFIFQSDFWQIVRYGLPAVTAGLLVFYLFKSRYDQQNYLLVQLCLVIVPWIGGSIYVFLSTSIFIGIVIYLINILHKFRYRKKSIISTATKKLYDRNLLPFIVSWLIYFIYSFRTGQIKPEIDGLLNSSNVLEKSSYPMDLASNLIDRPGLFIIVFFAMISIFCISAIYLVSNRSSEEKIINYSVLLVVTTAGIGSLYKWSFRGDSKDLTSIAMVSILLFIATIINANSNSNINKSLNMHIKVFLIVTTILGLYLVRNEVPGRIKGFIDNLDIKVAQSLLSENQDLKNRQIFRSDFSEIANIYDLEKYLNDNDLLPFYSPTDFGYLHVLTKQKPYFYISAYDSSTDFENAKLIELLNKNRPKSLILDQFRLSFDGVHLSLRHPNLIKWLIANYSLKDTIGSYFIFTQNSNDYLNNLAGWTKLLGDTDLGNVPYFIKEDRSCFKNEACSNYLKVKLIKDGDFCFVSTQTGGNINTYFFPIRYKSDYAIIPFDKLWSVNEDSVVRSVSCANEYVLFRNNLGKRLF
jgi:hypothetical protein